MAINFDLVNVFFCKRVFPFVSMQIHPVVTEFHFKFTSYVTAAKDLRGDR